MEKYFEPHDGRMINLIASLRGLPDQTFEPLNETVNHALPRVKVFVYDSKGPLTKEMLREQIMAFANRQFRNFRHVTDPSIHYYEKYQIDDSPVEYDGENTCDVVYECSRFNLGEYLGEIPGCRVMSLKDARAVTANRFIFYLTTSDHSLGLDHFHDLMLADRENVVCLVQPYKESFNLGVTIAQLDYTQRVFPVPRCLRADLHAVNGFQYKRQFREQFGSQVLFLFK